MVLGIKGVEFGVWEVSLDCITPLVVISIRRWRLAIE